MSHDNPVEVHWHEHAVSRQELARPSMATAAV